MVIATRQDALRFWRRSLLGLTALGLVARLGFVLLEPHAEPMGDEPSWIALGIGLARLRPPLSPLRSDLLFYPPGYPYFVAVPYLLTGGLEAVRWLQALLGALLVPAVGGAARHAFGDRAGLAAALMVALYPDLVWFSAHFWSETLFLVLLWWAFERTLAASRSTRLGSALTAGALWGAAGLTRETALYFVPVAAAWLLLSGAPEPGGETAPRAPAPVRFWRSGALLLAATLTVAPWTLRNWIVFRAVVPVSSFGPFNLWQGNTRLPREEVIRLSDSVEGAVPQYQLAWSMARAAIRERQPGWILEKIASELPAFWRPESQALVHLEQGAYGPASSAAVGALRGLVTAPYVFVLGLFALGLVAAPWDGRDDGALTCPTARWRSAAALLLAFLAYYNAIHVVTFGNDRFRLPVMPVLFAFAAAGLAAWQQRRLAPLSWSRGAVLAAVLVGLAWLAVPRPA